MSAADELARWVEKRPLVLIRLDENESEHLYESRRWPQRFTLVRPHTSFEGCRVPTACLIEMQEQGTTVLNLGIVKQRTAISTMDSRMTVLRVRLLSRHTLESLCGLIDDLRFSSMMRTRLSQAESVLTLSPELSASVIYALARDELNLAAIETAVAELTIETSALSGRGVVWAQADAVKMATTIFGLDDMTPPANLTVRHGSQTALSLVGLRYLEDNVITADSVDIPDFKRGKKDWTGRAIFRRGDERLVVYTANRGPLEKMLGVDLIYVNSTRSSIVMVQYKMLEQKEGKLSSGDWVFRLDEQAKKEIRRMKLPEDMSGLIKSGPKSLKANSKSHDYRLSSNPFYFKFVKRRRVNGSLPSLVMSLEHVNQLFPTSVVTRAKQSVCMSFSSLQGNYLRESDFIGLIRSGYIGTHRVESEWLKRIIDRVAKGNSALVLAWQEQIESEGK